MCSDGSTCGCPDVGRALPEDVRANVLGVFGSRGQAWLEDLPRLVGQLGARWELTFGRGYRGGTHSLVLQATRACGARAVLKVPVQDPENRAEAAALRRYAGDGAVLLFEADPASGALLLERLEPGTSLLDHPVREEAIDRACELLRRLRRPPGPGHPFTLVPDVAERWSEELPARHARQGRPFSTAMVGRAADLARELAVPAGEELLVNRDAHLGNVLAAEREPWLLIDPKPLAGEAAFDAGWLLVDLLGDRATPEEARRLARRVATGLGVDAGRVRDWALLRAIESAVWATDGHEDPRPYLEVAEALTGRR